MGKVVMAGMAKAVSVVVRAAQAVKVALGEPKQALVVAAVMEPMVVAAVPMPETPRLRTRLTEPHRATQGLWASTTPLERPVRPVQTVSLSLGGPGTGGLRLRSHLAEQVELVLQVPATLGPPKME